MAGRTRLSDHPQGGRTGHSLVSASGSSGCGPRIKRTFVRFVRFVRSPLGHTLGVAGGASASALAGIQKSRLLGRLTGWVASSANRPRKKYVEGRGIKKSRFKGALPAG
jgi:hypothetical protein